MKISFLMDFVDFWVSGQIDCRVASYNKNAPGNVSEREVLAGAEAGLDQAWEGEGGPGVLVEPALNCIAKTYMVTHGTLI